MNCQELHNHFETDRRVEADGLSELELAEHIAVCLRCNGFIEEQKELQEHLRMVRDSAPPVPPSVDKAVVVNYRSFVFEHLCLAKSIPRARPTHPRTALRWAAAVAFAMVVAYAGMLLFIPGQHVWVDQQGTVRQPLAPQAQRRANKEKAAAQAVSRKALTSYGRLGKRANNRSLPAGGNSSFTTRFQNLMYCDQISCPGAMDVIRVQLPSPVMGLTPSPGGMDGVVYADVLVGPDGIARGIRVVE